MDCNVLGTIFNYSTVSLLFLFKKNNLTERYEINNFVYITQIVSQATNHIRAFSMCLNKMNYSARKQTNCYIKYDREILGLIELIENIFEFVLKIKYPWLCITSIHICVPITIGIYDIILRIRF